MSVYGEMSQKVGSSSRRDQRDCFVRALVKAASWTSNIMQEAEQRFREKKSIGWNSNTKDYTIVNEQIGGLR